MKKGTNRLKTAGKSSMRILFVTDSYPNYVPDLLLHGLRKLFGPDVVDYPRKNCLYDGVLGLGVCPDDQRCPGWFPDDDRQIDRSDVWRKSNETTTISLFPISGHCRTLQTIWMAGQTGSWLSMAKISPKKLSTDPMLFAGAKPMVRISASLCQWGCRRKS